MRRTWDYRFPEGRELGTCSQPASLVSISRSDIQDGQRGRSLPYSLLENCFLYPQTCTQPYNASSYLQILCKPKCTRASSSVNYRTPQIPFFLKQRASVLCSPHLYHNMLPSSPKQSVSVSSHTVKAIQNPGHGNMSVIPAGETNRRILGTCWTANIANC